MGIFSHYIRINICMRWFNNSTKSEALRHRLLRYRSLNFYHFEELFSQFFFRRSFQIPPVKLIYEILCETLNFNITICKP